MSYLRPLAFLLFHQRMLELCFWQESPPASSQRCGHRLRPGRWSAVCRQSEDKARFGGRGHLHFSDLKRKQTFESLAHKISKLGTFLSRNNTLQSRIVRFHIGHHINGGSSDIFIIHRTILEFYRLTEFQPVQTQWEVIVTRHSTVFRLPLCCAPTVQ